MLNSFRGLIFAFVALIYYGALYFPSSIMQRPHYSFWRMLLAVTICYLLVLIFILFQVRKTKKKSNVN
jgi:Phosphatidyl serine synthase.